MENEESWKDKPRNTNAFYCNICKIFCASALNLQTHFLGNKHKAVEEALKSHGIVKPLKDSGEAVRQPESLPDYIQTEPEKHIGKTLGEQLNSCKDTEPAIGLEYIMEYRSKDNPIYECNLCISQGGLTNMFMHVLGNKHRLNYMKKHHPELADVKGRGSNLNRKIKELAALVEKEDGRKPIKSTMDLPIPKDDIYSVQHSDTLITWFTEDDTAKKAEDAEATKAKCDKSEDKKEAEQSTTQQQNAQLQEIDFDSDEFSSNKDLLKYLKSFEIVDEEDAAFILKVTQKLTNALVTYRERASESKSFNELHPHGHLGNQPEQRTAEGAAGPHDDFSQWQLPIENSFADTGTNSNVNVSVKRKASEMNTKPSKDAKTRKLGTFVSTFQEVPNEKDSCDTEGAGAAPGDTEGAGAASGDTEGAGATPGDTEGPAAAPGNTEGPAAAPDDTEGPAAAPGDTEGPAAAPGDTEGPAAAPGDTEGPAAAPGDTEGPAAAPGDVEGPGATPGDVEGPGAAPRDTEGPGAVQGPDISSSLQKQAAIPVTLPSMPSESESHIIARFFSSIRNMDADEVAATLQKIAESNPAFSGMDVQNVIKILTQSGTLKPKNTGSGN